MTISMPAATAAASGRSTGRARPSRLLLLSLAAGAVLSFGIRPRTPAASVFWWLVRFGGAGCAVAAMLGSKPVSYNPIADLKLAHEFELASLEELHEEAMTSLRFETLEERERQRLEIEQHYQAQFEGFKQHYKQQFETIAQQYEQLVRERNDKIEQLSQQMADAQAAYAAERSSTAERFQREFDRLEIMSAELEAERNRLKADREAVYDWSAKESASLREQERQAKADVEQRHQRNLQELERQKNSLIQMFEQETDRVNRLNQQQIDGYKRMIEDLTTTINTYTRYIYQLKQPEYTNGMTHYEMHADKVIQYFYEHGLIVRSPSVQLLGKYKFALSFGILPIPPGKNPEKEFAENLLDAQIRLESKLLKGIPAVLQGCKTTPTLSLSNRLLVVTIDVSGVDWNAPDEVSPIPEADPNWLLMVAEQGNHFRVTGPTDSGKSVLMDNLIGAMRRVWPDVGLTLADPKYPFTEWTTFNPNYKGVEECFASLSALEALSDSRFVLARREFDAGRPIPDFPPELFVLDEAEILMDDARTIDESTPPKAGVIKLQNLLARRLRKGLKLGRGLTKKKGKGLKVAYITQSPLCTRLKLNRDDFDQSVNIFIGENVVRALQEELKGKISSAERDELLNQYHLRIARGDKYFCLVKMPGKKAFLALMPAEGTYAPGRIETTLLSAPVPGTEGITLEDPQNDYLDDDDLEETIIDDDVRFQLESTFQLDAAEPESGSAGGPGEGNGEFRDSEAPHRVDFGQLSPEALELLGYVCTKGQRYANAYGWIAVAKLRDNWGRNAGLDTNGLKALLRQLCEAGAGEFQGDTEAFWRHRIDPKDLPGPPKNDL